METQELTPIVTAHQQAIARHEQTIAAHHTQHHQEIQEIRAVLAEIAQSQKRTETQQEANTQAIAQLAAESQLSRQDINSLTASITELRHLVADYMRSRSE